FDEIYQQETTEQFKPSSKKLKSEEISAGIFVNNFIRLLVACDFCGKYCCIYSKTILNDIEIEAIIQHFDIIIYSCGSFANTLYICLNLTCNSPIEHNYYSCRLKDVDLCFWCGSEDELLEIPSEMQENWKSIYPLCALCQIEGKSWETRSPKS
ncbi:35769_t:CDS:1, partial [Racocetra persica]